MEDETVASLLRKYLYYAYVRVLGRLLRHRWRDGERVMDREWDNLIVLDACRYDTFSEVNPLDGELEKIQSVGTSTPQWLKRNFTDQYDDVVYISANPYVSKIATDGYFDAEDHFHHVEHVWDTGWSEEGNTVPPENLNDAVREMLDDYPDKRFIIHYMQPHEPFLGDTRVNVEGEDWTARRWKQWHHPDIEQAYRENLELVLAAVDDIVDELDGRTVITSDHGEVLDGKYSLINHPKDVFIPDLQDVPWFVVRD